MKPLRLAAALLAATALSSEATEITVTGTIAPLFWSNSQGFLPSTVVDTTGIFGTPGEALAGDAFTVVWDLDALNQLTAGTLTINGHSVTFAAEGAAHVNRSLDPTQFYANITVTIAPAIAMNTYLSRPGGGLPGFSGGFTEFNPATDNLSSLGGGFNLSGFDGYFLLETLLVGDFVAPVPLGPPPGLLAGALFLLALWGRRKYLLTTPGGAAIIPPA